MKCHTSHNSGIWRCFCAVALLLTLASATCASAQTTQQYIWESNNNWTGTTVTTYCEIPDQCAQTGAGLLNEQAHNATYCTKTRCTTYGGATCTPDSEPTGAGQTTECEIKYTYTGSYGSGSGQNGPWGFTSVALPTNWGNCTQHNGSVSGLTAPISAAGTDKSGCVYVPDPNQVCGSIPGITQGMVCGVYYTGAWESAPSTQGTGTSSCVTAGATTACATAGGTNGPPCGTVNGDQACAAAMPPNGCVSYADGAMACLGNAASAPSDAPTTAGGSPAPAAATFQFGAPMPVATNNTSVYYYSQSTVENSGTPLFSQPATGTGTGTGGSGSTTGCAGTSTTPCVTQPVPNAANGDCGASANAANCTTTGSPLPSVNWTGDSWSGSTTAFVNAVETGPIGTAVTGLSNAWPSGGSCPAETVKLTTLNYTADYGTPLCNIWQSAALPILSDTMLAIWSIAAVIVFMSA